MRPDDDEAATESRREDPDGLPPELDAETLARWRPGDSVPSGYHAARAPLGGVVASIGAVAALGSYAVMVGLGLVGNAACFGLGSACAGYSGWWFVPVAGPFALAAQSSAGHASAERRFMQINGGLQLGGLVLAMIGGLIHEASSEVLVRDRAPSARKSSASLVRFEPMVGASSAGLGLSGGF
jgi:hypothetical protein